VYCIYDPIQQFVFLCVTGFHDTRDSLSEHMKHQRKNVSTRSAVLYVTFGLITN